MKILLSLSVLVLACMSLSQPKPMGANIPAAGKYTFTAWNDAGKKMYTGEFWIIRWTRDENGWSTKQGQRKVKALLPEKDLNPIDGSGYFEGTFQNGKGGFNLHPKYRDFNTTLYGEWKNGKLKGHWGSSTIVGYKKKGTFELVPVKPKTARTGKG